MLRGGLPRDAGIGVLGVLAGHSMKGMLGNFGAQGPDDFPPLVSVFASDAECDQVAIFAVDPTYGGGEKCGLGRCTLDGF